MDASTSSVNLQHHESGSSNTSPHYEPYPNPSVPFLEGGTPSMLCICCGFRGHRAATCFYKQSSHPERHLIMSWKNNHLEMSDGSHICLYFNIRNSCTLQPSAYHGTHSCSLCGDAHHAQAFAQEISLHHTLYIHTTPYNPSAGMLLWPPLTYCPFSLIWFMTFPMAP